MKSAYLLSFSLAFLAQGIAGDGGLGDGQNLGFVSVFPPAPSESREPRTSQPKSRWQSSPETQECISPFRRIHASIRHNESKGIGYDQGYSTLEVFGISDKYSTYFMPFLDLRGHVFNNGKLAGNVGIGERTLFPSINHTFGAYFYYDVRRVGKGLTVNQLSPGLELVGRRMEYRINGYFPVGKEKGHKYKYRFDDFEGNNILLKFRQYHAMRGGDAEVGAHITQSTKYDLYAAAGPYYFQASHANSWGGRTRLLGRYKDYVSLEVAYSYDHLFRSRVEGSVAFTLPLGRKLKRTGQGCPQANDLLLSRASFAPSRFEIPVVKKLHGTAKAINPATGQPWVVWFVNNTSSSAGTFESPFPTLVAAQNASSAGDAIYIFPGNGTTTGMDQGIQLKDQQKLFGSGIAQVFSTTHGSISVPAQSKNSPNITNQTLLAPAVNLGNDCEVAGLVISNTNGGNGINGGDSTTATAFLGITNAYIHDNAIINSSVVNGAINLHNCQGNLTVSNNYIDNITSGDGGVVSGINVFSRNFSVTASLVLTDNVIKNVTILTGGAGIRVQSAIPGIINALIQNNETFNTYQGISFTWSGISCGNISGNRIDQTAMRGIDIGSTGGSSVSANVAGNTMTNIGELGIFASSADTSSIRLQLTGNSSSSGYSLNQADSSTFTLFTSKGNQGIPFTTSGTIQQVAGTVTCP